MEVHPPKNGIYPTGIDPYSTRWENLTVRSVSANPAIAILIVIVGYVAAKR